MVSDKYKRPVPTTWKGPVNIIGRIDRQGIQLINECKKVPSYQRQCHVGKEDKRR